jgi:hypothetical protein
MIFLRGVFKLAATAIALWVGVLALSQYITQSAALVVYDASCAQECRTMAIAFGREHQSSDGMFLRNDGGAWTKPVSENGQAFSQIYVNQDEVIGLLANSIVSLHPKTSEYEVLFQGGLQIHYPSKHGDWLVYSQFSEPNNREHFTNPLLYLFSYNTKTQKTERLLEGIGFFRFSRASFSQRGVVTFSTDELLADGYSTYDPINVKAENILRGNHVFQFKSIESLVGHFDPIDMVPHQVQTGTAPISLNRSNADMSAKNIIAFSYSPIWSWVHLDVANQALRNLPFNESYTSVTLLPDGRKYVAVAGINTNALQIILRDLATNQVIAAESIDIRKPDRVVYKEKHEHQQY